MSLPSRDFAVANSRPPRAAALILSAILLAPGLALASSPITDPASASGDGASAAASSAPAEETLLLDVQINGHSIGKIGEFILRRGKLMTRTDELLQLGFRVPASVSATADGLIVLSQIPGLSWSIDQATQELRITANEKLLLPAVLQPERSDEPEGHRTVQSGTGATLNYDTVETYADGRAGATTSLDLRAFSPSGVASSQWLTYNGASANPSGTKTPIRLDSTYTFSDVNTLRRYSAGDFITSGLAWTRPVHLEGFQVRSDFSMRPDLVTFPLPSVAGSAAVPSTVQVLADGNLVVSSQVAAGPFETPQLPVMSGAGSISMTVTNPLGQQMTVTQPFYASSALLTPGLSTFAGEVGLVRLNWGSVSNQYGKLAGSGIYRRGLTRHLTLEGNVEGTPGALTAGAGSVIQIGTLGVINLAAAASTGAGAQISAGAQRIGRIFSLGGSAVMATRNYRDIAALNGSGVQRKQLSAFASVSLRRFGSTGLAYAGVDHDAKPTPQQQAILFAQHSHVVSANYSLQIRHTSIYAAYFKDFSNGGNSNGLQVGLTLSLGRRNSANVSAASDHSVQIQAQKSASQIGDWGYDAYISEGNFDHEFGQVQYKSRVGMLTAGVDQSAGQTTLRMESQGALSLVDRALFPSNTIYDSFAIVDTGALPYVHVMQENRDVGRTSSSGRLLVPDMRSFDLNHIAVNPADIPADATLNSVQHDVRPQDRSGVVVKFPVKISHGALLKLVDEQGDPLALGCSAVLRATATASPVGYDGEAYVENLGPHNVLRVDRLDGQHCTVAFDYLAIPGNIPTIGPLRCVKDRP